MMGFLHKACDRCRAKKIRCASPNESRCEYCQSRDLPCNFSSYRRRNRRRNRDELVQVATHQISPASAPRLSSLAQPYTVEDTVEGYPNLYIDYLLERGLSHLADRPNSSHDQLTTLLGPSPNISFFPAQRVHAISHQLGNNRLDYLLEAIRAVIASKLKSPSALVASSLDQNPGYDAENAHESAGGTGVQEYIKTYMDLVHPFYPFLCRGDFEKRAFAPGLVQDLVANKSWACLYYAVVAVGCQHNDGGSYEPRNGTSWAYFQQSMGYCRDLIFPKGLLTSVQALMALALFCQSISAYGLEYSMIAEAAVMAQGLGLNRSTSASESSSIRTFWTLYYMEKTTCFTGGKVPTLQDSYISCPFPNMSQWAFTDYDWFLSFVKYSRLTSKIHSRLLTVTSVPKSWATCRTTIQSLQTELERWRDSIPRRFRPGEPLRPRMLVEPRALSIALRTHYYYHYAYLTLTWTLLHCGNNRLDIQQELDLKTELMQTARSILELTSYIEISPSTPVWILALTPLSALMILFDQVIHNPRHPETSLNLALLDIASGHFSRIEFSSKGVLPGSLISEFAHLARQYISDLRHAVDFSASLDGGLKIKNGGIAQRGQRSVDDQTIPSLMGNNISSESEVPATFAAEGTKDKIPSLGTPIHQGINCFVDMGQGQQQAADLERESTSTSSSLSEMVTGTVPAVQQGQSQSQIFFPTELQLQYLGVDLMGLFDPTYPLFGYDAPPNMQDSYRSL